MEKQLMKVISALPEDTCLNWCVSCGGIRSFKSIDCGYEEIIYMHYDYACNCTGDAQEGCPLECVAAFSKSPTP